MVYQQCADRLGVSDDGQWIQIDKGWVAADFVEMKEVVSTPTLPSTSSPTLITPTIEPQSTQTPTSQSFTILQPEPDPQIPNLPDPSLLTGWLIANPLRVLLLLPCFYMGLVSAQKFMLGRQILNGFLAILFAGIIITMWNSFFGRLIPKYYVRIEVGILFELISLSLVAYIGGLLLGKLIYRSPGKVERGANTKCTICGQMQRQNHMRHCPNCHQPFCDFPIWNHSSIRATIDGIVLWIAIPVGIILTAVSILGGVLVLAILSVPYILLRELLPENKIPSYWKNCGRDGYCSRCAVKLKPLPVYSGSSNLSSSRDSAYDYPSSSSNDASYEDDHSRDDDDDRHKGGSLWDGWLFSYSDNKDDDDDE